jgi:hypothetical protein
MLPDPDSDLVDAIDDEVCPEDESDNDDFDQRGVEREQGDGCDIGAVEILEPIVGTIVTPGGTVPWRMLNAVDADVVYQGVSGLSPAPPASVAFPYGALGSDIQVLANGWPADVQLYSPAPTTQVWKLFDGAWVNPPGATSVSGGGGTLWTFRLVDGGFGDNDGAADGTIHDPSALSVTAVFAG